MKSRGVNNDTHWGETAGTFPTPVTQDAPLRALLAIRGEMVPDPWRRISLEFYETSPISNCSTIRYSTRLANTTHVCPWCGQTTDLKVQTIPSSTPPVHRQSLPLSAKNNPITLHRKHCNRDPARFAHRAELPFAVLPGLSLEGNCGALTRVEGFCRWPDPLDYVHQFARMPTGFWNVWILRPPE